MLRLITAMLVILSASALAGQDFQLRDANSQTASFARLTANQLQITNNGQTSTYDRAQRHDAPGYTAYANPGLRQVIRWPNTNQGRMQIGSVSGLRMSYRASQMEIFPVNTVLRPSVPHGGFPHGGVPIGGVGAYRLQKGTETGSAVVTSTALTLRIGVQQATYGRDPTFDARGYVAYANANLTERVIRWPNNIQDPIIIGQQVGNQIFYRRAVMQVIAPAGTGQGGFVGGAPWRAETNLAGRPVVRSVQALPANQLISIRILAIAAGRSIGIGPVGGQGFDKVWAPTQFAAGSTLTYTPNVAARFGIGVGTAAGYDAVVVSHNNGVTRLTYDGGTVLEIGGGSVARWQRAATLGGVFARSAAALPVGARIQIHVITSAPGSTISLSRAGANVADKSWNSAQAPTGSTLTHVVPLASLIDISVRSNFAQEDVAITALPSATRLTFTGGTVLDVK